MKPLAITNVRIAAEDGIWEQGTVYVKEGSIHSMEKSVCRLSEAWEKLDGQGCLLIPGMVDVHIHGANGSDMMDGTTASVEEVSRMCARTGCTSFLATSVTSSIEDLLAMIGSVRNTIGREPGARIAGLHLEGPYLHPKRKGMQNERHLRHPDLSEMGMVLDKAEGLVRMVTLAPELPGGLELVRFLREKGIVVAVAHSDADYEEAKQAFEQGASHVTHCFNGMRPIHHRDPGVVVAAFEQPHVSLQAIVDDVHLHPAIVRLMFRIKGADGMVLITDALQAMGMGDGLYTFGGHEVTVKEGVARLNDGTLSSSTVTMNEALRRTVNNGIPLWDAVMMATRTPASVLGLFNKGRIAPGADADLVLLDDDFQVLWTMIGGKILPA